MLGTRFALAGYPGGMSVIAGSDPTILPVVKSVALAPNSRIRGARAAALEGRVYTNLAIATMGRRQLVPAVAGLTYERSSVNRSACCTADL